MMYALYAKKGKRLIRVPNATFPSRKIANKRKEELGGKIFGKPLYVRKVKTQYKKKLKKVV